MVLICVVVHMSLKAIKLRSVWSQVRDQVYIKTRDNISRQVTSHIYRRADTVMSNNVIRRVRDHLFDEIETYYDDWT